ncbi:MAG: anti-sigma factor antagonist [Actinomycetota bacterium]|jgi:anti-anti-sigma factor|nr:anti-sigma factor antagonist [Actinomycetota bacterium]
MSVSPRDTIVVPCRGELTIREAPALRDSLLAAIRAGAALVVLDLTEVSFIDQAAVGVLVGARQRLVVAGGELRLAAPAKQVARVLGLLGLEESLPTYPSVAAAVEDPRAT